MSSASTKAILGTIRARIVAFVPLSGTALGSARVYANGPLEGAAFPYIVLRLVNQISDGLRMTADLEAVVFHRPRSKASEAEDMADVMDGALLDWRDREGTGLIFAGERLRDTVAPFSEPADRELVQVRMIYSLLLYPEYLTQYQMA